MSEKAVAAFVKSDIAMRFLDQLRYFLRIYYLVSCYIIIISFVFSFPIQFLAFPKLILINLSYCNVEGGRIYFSIARKSGMAGKSGSN